MVCVPQHGVEDGQPLARHRDDRDKFRLAGLDEALPEGPRQRVGAAATSAPMKSAARTLALPPPMQRALPSPGLPRHGATPATRDRLFCRREQRPSCRAVRQSPGALRASCVQANRQRLARDRTRQTPRLAGASSARHRRGPPFARASGRARKAQNCGRKAKGQRPLNPQPAIPSRSDPPKGPGSHPPLQPVPSNK